jgi:predicted P-loop ATPase
MTIKFKETILPERAFNRVLLVKEFLEQHYDIKLNIFDHSRVLIESRTKKYTEEIKFEDIAIHLQEEGITGCDSLLKKILTSPNQTRSYNPIKEYFDGLKGKYTGESHIVKLCGYLKARDYGDQPEGFYQNRLVYTLRKWIVATVACAMGIKENDAMFVVVNSEEGIGKSTLLEFLMPGCLKPFYSKSSKEMNMAQMFASNLILNFDEMVGLTKSTAELFKNILSSSQISIAGRFSAPRQRYASACGTTNRDADIGGFLTHDMGLRRFAVNHIDHINWEYIKEVLPDQIWAEAVMLLEQDFEFTWNPTDYKQFAQYNTRFVGQTSSFMLINEFYRIPQPGEQDLAVFKLPMEILHDLRNARKIKSTMNSVNEVNIGIAMKQIGHLRIMKKIGGNPRYGYNVIPMF